MQSKQLVQALAYATEKHAGQFRDDGVEYIVHPKRVQQRLVDIGVTDEDVLIAALLHDTLEDTSATEEEITKLFNERVTRLVKWVTSDDETIRSYAQQQFDKYQSDASSCETASIVEELKRRMPDVNENTIKKRLGKAYYLTDKLNHMESGSALVKLSDRIDNLTDIEKPQKETRPEDAKFLIEYYAETRYIVSHLDEARFTSDQHKTLVKQLQAVLDEIQTVLDTHVK